MRMPVPAYVVGAAMLCSGCSLVSDATHVTAARVSQAVEDAREWRRDQELAAAAWDEIRCGPGGRGYSPDYAGGHAEGFATHLFRGATEPPPVPPQRYRSVANQTPQGYQAATDWLNGYRRGIDDAQARGLRQYMTGPSSLRTAARPSTPAHGQWLGVDPGLSGPPPATAAAADPPVPAGRRVVPDADPTPPAAAAQAGPSLGRPAPDPPAAVTAAACPSPAVNPAVWSATIRPASPSTAAGPLVWRAAGEGRP